jgi:hypothetical protein
VPYQTSAHRARSLLPHAHRCRLRRHHPHTPLPVPSCRRTGSLLAEFACPTCGPASVYSPVSACPPADDAVAVSKHSSGLGTTVAENGALLTTFN